MSEQPPATPPPPPAAPPPPPPPPPSASPPPPPPSYSPGGAAAVAAPVGNQKALWSLILGIAGLVCCGLVAGIPALILGNIAKKEIAASGGTQSGGGMAQAGFVLGIISIVWTVFWLFIYFVLIAGS